MKKYKRFRAMFLALVMALSLMPAMVFADIDEEDCDYYPDIHFDESVAIFPGDTVEVNISDNWFIPELPATAEIVWSIGEDTDDLVGCSITPDLDDMTRAYVTAGDGGGFIQVVCTIIDGSKVIGQGWTFFSAYDPYYKVVADDFDENLPVGESMTIHPVLLAATKETGNTDFEPVDGAAFTLNTYDQYGVRITHNNDGSITIKRLVFSETGFELLGYLPNDPENDVAHSDLWFADGNVYPITDANITGIKNKTYTGSAVRQAPVVEYEGRALKRGKDYKVSYKHRVDVGTATVVIKGIGKYYGKETVKFKINPKPTAIESLTAESKGFTAKWDQQSEEMSESRITGYQLQYCRNSEFKAGAKVKTYKGFKTVSGKVTGLKAGKRYYVRVRTYKTIDGKRYYSPWSKSEHVTTME